MKAYYVKQGDAYSIPVTVTADGSAVTDNMLDALEVMVGPGLRKTWPDGEIEYDEDTDYWLLPLTQAETFALPAGSEIALDVRAKTNSGDVMGTAEPMRVRIVPAASTAEL